MTQPIHSVFDWEDPDVLGFKASDTWLQHIPQVMRQSFSCSITSIGNRPKDYVCRDVSFAPQQRDRRCWVFNQLSRKRPPWMFQDLPMLSRPEQHNVAKFRALQFVHLHHLARIERHVDEHSLRAITQLWNCWPYTVKVAWNGSHTKSNRDVCELAHQCPFCFARSVRELYERLQHFCCADRDSLLVLMRVVISDHQLSCDSALDLPKARREFASQDIGTRLKKLTQDFGVEGGITTFQMGPQQWNSVVWNNDETALEKQYGFQYTISVLGEVRAHNNVSLLAEAQCENGIEPTIIVGDTTISVSVTVRSLDDPQSLRILLVGTSPKYQRNSELAPGGHEGAFALQPWMLSNFSQWEQHLQLSKGMRLFSPWGTWMQQIPKAVKSHRMVNAPVRRPQYRRKEALRRSNQERSNAVAEATASLLPACRELVEQNPQFRLRPPGRQKIRELFTGKGIEVSDRQARRLAEELRSLSSAPVTQAQHNQPEVLQ